MDFKKMTDKELEILLSQLQAEKSARLAAKKKECLGNLQKALEEYCQNFGDLHISTTSGEDYYLNSRYMIYDADRNEVIFDLDY